MRLEIATNFHDQWVILLARELDIEPYVTFTGRVGPTEIDRYLRSSRIVYQPGISRPAQRVQ
jgi:hypothetical protein